MPEAISFKLCSHGWRVQAGVILLLGFGWRYVADGLQNSPVVEPVDPFQSGELDRLGVAPRPMSMDNLGLVETVDRFRECVVVAVADASDRGLNACFCQPLGIANGYVLNAPVRVMHETASMSGTPIIQSLLQSIEDETCGVVLLTRHPTMRRAKASITKAT